jgi:YHS domain-containing protein
MIGWAIRLLLIIFVVRALTRLWRGVVEGMRLPQPEPPSAVPLARDPVCGTFVVPARALSGGTGADTRFFCSENCRRTYELKLSQGKA